MTPPMRVALVLVLLCLAAPAAAVAQSSPFGPLPQAQEATPVPTPIQNQADQGQVSRPLLLGIAGVVAILFLGIGFYISRDARRNLTESDRAALENRDRGERPLSPGERKQAERTKARARAKRSAQKQARKQQRR